MKSTPQCPHGSIQTVLLIAGVVLLSGCVTRYTAIAQRRPFHHIWAATEACSARAPSSGAVRGFVGLSGSYGDAGPARDRALRIAEWFLAHPDRAAAASDSVPLAWPVTGSFAAAPRAPTQYELLEQYDGRRLREVFQACGIPEPSAYVLLTRRRICTNETFDPNWCPNTRVVDLSSLNTETSVAILSIVDAAMATDQLIGSTGTWRDDIRSLVDGFSCAFYDLLGQRTTDHGIEVCGDA